MVVSVPFIYFEHGTPHDYRRFSRHEITPLLAPDLQVTQVIRQGGAGSTLGTLFLGWLQLTLGGGPRQLLLLLLLPFWLALTTVVNCVSWAIDRIDRTGILYANVLAVAVKTRDREPATTPIA